MISLLSSAHWRDLLEIAILWVVLFNAWRFFRGTRGAKVLTGLAMLLLAVALLSELFELPEISWLFRNLITFLAFALVVIFQPELRRALAALGSHPIFASVSQSRETIEVLAAATFALANRQLGALIAVERDTNIDTFAETGVQIDCQLSAELAVSLFFPKAPLHDGGVIVRNGRIVSAACVFPVSQRVDLDRTLGTRHRAALGLSEESDAVVIVVSEETGIVSICHRGQIERNFDPESLKQRLAELLLLENIEHVENPAPGTLGREDHFPGSGRHTLGGDQKKHPDDRLAF